MAAFSRARHLQRLFGRIERLIADGTAVSSRFTTYRLSIFVAGIICSVTLFRSGYFQSGNAALAGFVVLFLIVASYHNRLEQRIHRLRLWTVIKSAHLARVHLAWSQIPYKPMESFPTHLYAQDLDVTGPSSLLHLLDTSVSDQGRTRLTSWLLTQPPDSRVWDTRQALVKELCRRSLVHGSITVDGDIRSLTGPGTDRAHARSITASDYVVEKGPFWPIEAAQQRAASFCASNAQLTRV